MTKPVFNNPFMKKSEEKQPSSKVAVENNTFKVKTPMDVINNLPKQKSKEPTAAERQAVLRSQRINNSESRGYSIPYPNKNLEKIPMPKFLKDRHKTKPVDWSKNTEMVNKNYKKNK